MQLSLFSSLIYALFYKYRRQILGIYTMPQ